MAVTSGAPGNAWYSHNWVVPVALFLLVLCFVMAISLFLFWRRTRKLRDRELRNEEMRRANRAVSVDVFGEEQYNDLLTSK